MARPKEVFLIGGPIILEELPSDRKTAKTIDKRHRRKSGYKISRSIGQRIHNLID